MNAEIYTQLSRHFIRQNHYWLALEAGDDCAHVVRFYCSRPIWCDGHQWACQL